MNELVQFQFESYSIRTITDEHGEPLFSLSDLCKALDISNPSRVKSDMLDPEEVQVVDFRTLRNTEGGEINTLHNFVTESGMYHVTFQSRKPEAKRFRKWVTSEVLPAIRKTGTYTAPNAPKATTPIIEASKVFKALNSVMRSIGLDKNAAALSANQGTVQTVGVNILQLTGATHLISETQQQWFTPTQLSKDMNISAADFNKVLEKGGYQVKTDNGWTPTEKGKPFSRVFDTSKRHSKGTPVTQLKWSTTILTEVVDREVTRNAA